MSTKNYELHPMAETFSPLTEEEYADLKRDMQERYDKGLPPLEQPIILYEGKILDGWHRNKAWYELELPGHPPFTPFSPNEHGTLAVWLKVKSLNLVHRQVSADQRAQIFLAALELYPELSQVIQQVKQENLQRRSNGKPLAAGEKRGNSASHAAKIACVSETTLKENTRLRKKSPERAARVARGESTTNKELAELTAQEQQNGAGTSTKKKKPKPNAGDVIYTVETCSRSNANNPRLHEFKVQSVDGDRCKTTNGKVVNLSAALTLPMAKAERTKRIDTDIKACERALAELKDARTKEPTIIEAKKA